MVLLEDRVHSTQGVLNIYMQTNQPIVVDVSSYKTMHLSSLIVYMH